MRTVLDGGIYGPGGICQWCSLGVGFILAYSLKKKIQLIQLMQL